MSMKSQIVDGEGTKRGAGVTDKNAVKVAPVDTDGDVVNPSKEDGNLASIKVKTDNLDAKLSTLATEVSMLKVKRHTGDMVEHTRHMEYLLSIMVGEKNMDRKSIDRGRV